MQRSKKSIDVFYKEANFQSSESEKEHISLILELSSDYFGRFTQSPGKTNFICTDFIDFLKNNEIGTARIIAIEYDLTNLTQKSKAVL